MCTAGVVTQHLINLIEKQVDDNGLVVWYDPEGAYTFAINALNLPDTAILQYDGSFMDLRWKIDQIHLLDSEQAPRLVVFVPKAQNETHHALIELESAGVIMQPGQQPPMRNTKLSIVARNALKGLLGDEAALDIEKQVEAGKLNLADVNDLAEKGGEIAKSLIAIIFGKGNPQEVALLFLNDDRYDSQIEQKQAKNELSEFFSQELDIKISENTGLGEIRKRLERHVLLTDLVVGLGDVFPQQLASIPIASTSHGKEACKKIAYEWRLHRDIRDSYVIAAKRVEQEFSLGRHEFDPQKIAAIDTFPFIEKTLVRHAENRLLDKTDDMMLSLAESRLLRFWCDVEPRFQAQWALILTVAGVLFEADRVEIALKTAAKTLSDFIMEYADSKQPWCLLDTHHRHMESRLHNIESDPEGDDVLEKLVVKARQRYTQVVSKLTRCFISSFQDGLTNTDILRQMGVFEKFVKASLGKEKIAYFWIDAMRFEIARELARLLKEYFEIELRPALAAVPTITEIGMAALLPGAQMGAKVVSIGNGKLALELQGKIIKDRADRIKYLGENVYIKVFEAKLDNLLSKPLKNSLKDGIKGADLILITSQEIDELCEQDNIAQARRQMDGVLSDLKQAVLVLVGQGIEHIVLAADHGYLFADELTEDMKIDPPGGETVDLHRRVWVGRGGNADEAFVRLPLNKLGMQGDYDIATPWSFACFKCPGGARAYFHGGLSPQEMIVPIMNLKSLAKTVVRPKIDVSWELTPGSSKVTTRFFSVQITGFNSGLFVNEPPKVRVEMRFKGKVVSRAVSASYGFDEATGEVLLKYLESDPKKIMPNTVTLMVVEESNLNAVDLLLIEATTGAELKSLDKIEVSIAM